MSRASNFAQRRVGAFDMGGPNTNVAPRRRTPVTQAEIDFVLARAKAIPGITGKSLRRLVLRSFGVSRAEQTLEKWVAEDRAGNTPVAPPPATKPKSRRTLAEIRARGCSVDGCDKPHRGKGLCSTHYTRQWKAEQATTTPKETTP